VLTEKKMTLVLGLNILLESPSDSLHRRSRVKNHQHKLPQNSWNYLRQQ